MPLILASYARAHSRAVFNIIKCLKWSVRIARKSKIQNNLRTIPTVWFSNLHGIDSPWNGKIFLWKFGNFLDNQMFLNERINKPTPKNCTQYTSIWIANNELICCWISVVFFLLQLRFHTFHLRVDSLLWPISTFLLFSVACIAFDDFAASSLNITFDC